MTKSHAHPHDPGLAPLLQRYRLGAVLGQGGFGMVYRGASLEHPTREVAIKVLTLAGGDVAEVTARAVREVANAQAVDHPNVVRVYEHGTLPDRRAYMVMELALGPSLRSLHEQFWPLDPAFAVGLVCQILRGLEAAHAAGLVHRDMKPDNVHVETTLTPYDTVKILDFGLAKRFDGSTLQDVTSQGKVLCSMQYAALEQLMGQPLDARADLYAAAVLLYELLAGRLPFDGDAPLAIASAQIAGKYPKVSELRGAHAVLAPLDAVLTKALQREPKHRYPNARSLRGALRDAMPACIGHDHDWTAAPSPNPAPSAPVVFHPDPRYRTYFAPASSGAKTIRMLAERFQIVRELPQPSTRGRVYEGVDGARAMPVFVKVLRPATELTADDQRRFLRGVRLLATVDHANIVRWVGGGVTPEGAPFFATEWFPGRTLASRLAGPRPPLEAVATVGCRLLDALQALHDRGLVHREVRPGHVLVLPTTHGPIVKLFGFEVAKALAADAEQITQWDEAVGTPRYMSPEQLLGQGIDHRTDLFALGLLLYEMAAGKPAYPGETIHELARGILHGPPPELPDYVDVQTRVGLTSIIQRALSPDVRARYPSAAAMREDLLPRCGGLQWLREALG